MANATEWLSIQEAIALIRRRLNCSMGRAETVLREARKSGEVRQRKDVELRAFDDIPDSDGSSGDDLEKDDLLYWLDRQTANKGGRRRKYNDADIKRRVWELMDHHGDFMPTDKEWDTPARLVATLEAEFDLGRSTLYTLVPPMIDEWRESKN